MEQLSLVEAFERTALALPFEDEFRDVEIVTHRAQRHGRTTALSLVVDRPSGVDISLCERVATRINEALNHYSDYYTLEVESPGLDRPLLRPGDYERFRDRDVCIVTNVPIEGRKTHRGRLLGIRGMNVLVQADAETAALPIDAIKSARLSFDPRADLRRAKQEKKRP